MSFSQLPTDKLALTHSTLSSTIQLQHCDYTATYSSWENALQHIKNTLVILWRDLVKVWAALFWPKWFEWYIWTPTKHSFHNSTNNCAIWYHCFIKTSFTFPHFFKSQLPFTLWQIIKVKSQRIKYKCFNIHFIWNKNETECSQSQLITFVLLVYSSPFMYVTELQVANKTWITAGKY